MTIHNIDNSSSVEFGKVILWQYDNAENLVALIKSFLGIYDATTKLLWNKYAKELDVDNATDYGLTVIGNLIGCPRPDDLQSYLYRRILKARFQLSQSDYSVASINKYLHTIFHGSVSCIDNNDMSISWSIDSDSLNENELDLIMNYRDIVAPYPVAVREPGTYDEIIFGITEDQPVDTTNVIMNGKDIGGLDDSSFFDDNADDSKYIPEHERINQ